MTLHNSELVFLWRCFASALRHCVLLYFEFEELLKYEVLLNFLRQYSLITTTCNGTLPSLYPCGQ